MRRISQLHHKSRAGTKVQREEPPNKSGEQSVRGLVGAIVGRSYAVGAREELDIQNRASDVRKKWLQLGETHSAKCIHVGVTNLYESCCRNVKCGYKMYAS